MLFADFARRQLDMVGGMIKTSNKALESLDTLISAAATAEVRRVGSS